MKVRIELTLSRASYFGLLYNHEAELTEIGKASSHSLHGFLAKTQDPELAFLRDAYDEGRLAKGIDGYKHRLLCGRLDLTEEQIQKAKSVGFKVFADGKSYPPIDDSPYELVGTSYRLKSGRSHPR